MAQRKAKRDTGAYAQETGDFFDTSTVQVAGIGIKVTWAVNRCGDKRVAVVRILLWG